MSIGLIFGRHEAMADCLRDTGELIINLPALRRPTLQELQAQYPGIKSIERDASPESPVTLSLATVLKPGETCIRGGEYERRLAPNHIISLGFQHRQWLLAHQDGYPSLNLLLGKIHIDFPGIIVRLDDGFRRIPCCRRGVTRWIRGWYWLDDRFLENGRVAVAGT